jgi:F0F1-type ATP synthase assembly protein I
VRVVAPRLGKQADIWAQVAYYSGLGFIIPGGAVGGYSLGWLLSGWLHTGPWLAVVMAFFGVAGGIVEVLQLLTRAERKNSNGNDSTPGPR